jgi:hypothetical protein
MFDFVTGSDLIPDSGHPTGFGIGLGIHIDWGFSGRPPSPRPPTHMGYVSHIK